jgi:hypothetical protein
MDRCAIILFCVECVSLAEHSDPVTKIWLQQITRNLRKKVRANLSKKRFMDLYHSIFQLISHNTAWHSTTRLLILEKYIQIEIKNRINTVNSCYHAVQNLSSCRLLSKNVKIRTQEIITSPFILHRRETWTLREKHRFRVSVHVFLRRTFVPDWNKVMGW